MGPPLSHKANAHRPPFFMPEESAARLLAKVREEEASEDTLREAASKGTSCSTAELPEIWTSDWPTLQSMASLIGCAAPYYRA